MTKEEKQLLLNDLCARLPHYTMVLMDDGGVELLVSVNVDTGICNGLKGLPKPYLRPMSSMTEEEVKEIRKINWQFWKPKNDSDECFVGDADDGYCSVSQMARITNYLNAHHFDYLGLIPKGLALEAPEGMYVNV